MLQVIVTLNQVLYPAMLFDNRLFYYIVLILSLWKDHVTFY